MDYCKFHSNKVAHVRCKTCFIPLCDDCKVVTDIGVFCSEECHEKAKEFQNKVRPSAPRVKHPSFFSLVLKILVVIVLIIVIALGLDYLGIVTLPFVSTLRDLLGL
jgi:hypothetical protein